METGKEIKGNKRKEREKERNNNKHWLIIYILRNSGILICIITLNIGAIDRFLSL
jgi:hypothetical protein